MSILLKKYGIIIIFLIIKNSLLLINFVQLDFFFNFYIFPDIFFFLILVLWYHFIYIILFFNVILFYIYKFHNNNFVYFNLFIFLNLI